MTAINPADTAEASVWKDPWRWWFSERKKAWSHIWKGHFQLCGFLGGWVPRIEWDNSITFLPPQSHFLTSQGLESSTQGPRGHASPCSFTPLTVPFYFVSARQLPIRRVRGAGKRPQGADVPRIHCQLVRVWHQAHGGWSPHGVPEQGTVPLVLPPVSCDIQPRHPCRASSAGGDQSSPHLWTGHQQPDAEGKRPGTRGSRWRQQQQRAFQMAWGGDRVSWAQRYNTESEPFHLTTPAT